ncbi:hypothetical protein PLUTE_a2770 [Pseudoalteromonas luteoviolacea DSM 6061]|nr:hypothetical protein [Pseudoalteromonas luteoviolacea DSM 6061]
MQCYTAQLASIIEIVPLIRNLKLDKNKTSVYLMQHPKRL